MSAAIANIAQLLAALRNFHVLSPEQLEGLAKANLPTDVRALAKALVQRELLTKYQVNELFVGRGEKLVFGSYVLMESLGEGGMGQVFKARNWKLGHIVALKLMRKERLAHANAVKRFHREVVAASQLRHPNIVRAIDADQANGTHYFVMEYVEGTDLNQLVKSQGALEVRQACDYVRQAALGLQHAFEQGMVHRDIKPHNLFLTLASLVRNAAPHGARSSLDSGVMQSDYGLIKILDMGLALRENDADGGHSSTMTQEGAVMGTPDYIAPEQSLDSHSVDIRADLYSLGCTLYFLIAGQAPFSGGSMMEKLLKHQQQMPTALSLIRPEVPPDVEAIVFRLLAKRPEQRYQTPVELAQALVNFFQGVPAAPAPAVLPPIVQGRAAPVPLFDDLADSALQFSDSSTPLVLDVLKKKSPPQRKLPWLWAVGAGALVVTLAVVLTIVVAGRERKKADDGGDHGKKKAPPPKSVVKFNALEFEAWVNLVRDLPPAEQILALTDKMQQLNRGFNGIVHHLVENGAIVEVKLTSDEVSDVDPLRALPRLARLECIGSQPGKGQLSDLNPVMNMKLTRLVVSNNRVSNLTPLRGLPLATLICDHTEVADLAPLKDVPLTTLNCAHTKVANLAPLKGSQVATLILDGSPVNNLAPLQGSTLTELSLEGTQVADLAPLKGMNLKLLDCRNSYVADYKLLADISVERLRCDFSPWRDPKVLRPLKTLVAINDKSVEEFWKNQSLQQDLFESWRSETAKLHGQPQIEAVTKKLRELNPGAPDKFTYTLDKGGAIVSLIIPTNQVTNLSPVRAVPSLVDLDCSGTGPNLGRLIDLYPLVGQKLKRLRCANNRLSDLAPLLKMPLKELDIQNTRVATLVSLAKLPLEKLLCGGTQVKDLTPLKKAPLVHLEFASTQVPKLAPLEGMNLTYLNCASTPIADLTPLRKMPLAVLFMQSTKVTDYELLRDLPLTQVTCDFIPWRDAGHLRPIATLEKVNGKPAAEMVAWAVWEEKTRTLTPDQQLEALKDKLLLVNPKLDVREVSAGKIDNGKIVELNVYGEEIVDIAPIRVLRDVHSLHLGTATGSNNSSKLVDIRPLQGLNLKQLSLHGSRVVSLTALKEMDLAMLDLSETPVTDLAPIKESNLEVLTLPRSVTNLQHLKTMPKLRELHGIAEPARHRALLKALPQLQIINGKPAVEVLK